MSSKSNLDSKNTITDVPQTPPIGYEHSLMYQ